MHLLVIICLCGIKRGPPTVVRDAEPVEHLRDTRVAVRVLLQADNQHLIKERDGASCLFRLIDPLDHQPGSSQRSLRCVDKLTAMICLNSGIGVTLIIAWIARQPKSDCTTAISRLPWIRTGVRFSHRN